MNNVGAIREYLECLFPFRNIAVIRSISQLNTFKTGALQKKQQNTRSFYVDDDFVERGDEHSVAAATRKAKR